MGSRWQVQQAARVVREGGVIAYPTEAVWGLGCDPWNELAVDRLLALKERPMDKGLILVANDIQQFDFLLDDLPDVWQERLASTWPGPNTWLVPHQDRLPQWITLPVARRRVRGYGSSSISRGNWTRCWAARSAVARTPA